LASLVNPTADVANNKARIVDFISFLRIVNEVRMATMQRLTSRSSPAGLSCQKVAIACCDSNRAILMKISSRRKPSVAPVAGRRSDA
jgi:hypothetical protein